MLLIHGGGWTSFDKSTMNGMADFLLWMEDTRDNSDPALAWFSSKVQAVVDVSGPTDFTVEKDPEDTSFLENFLGADYLRK